MILQKEFVEYGNIQGCKKLQISCKSNSIRRNAIIHEDIPATSVVHPLNPITRTHTFSNQKQVQAFKTNSMTGTGLLSFFFYFAWLKLRYGAHVVQLVSSYNSLAAVTREKDSDRILALSASVPRRLKSDWTLVKSARTSGDQLSATTRRERLFGLGKRGFSRDI